MGSTLVPLQNKAAHPMLDAPEAATAPAERAWDKSEKGSLASKLPTAIVRACEEHIRNNRALFLLSEADLRAEFKTDKFNVSPTMHLVRMKFWLEYDRAMSKNEPMDVDLITVGIFKFKEQFFQFLNKYQNVAWMLCPPSNYIVVLEEALEFGAHKMRDALNHEWLDDKTGKVNTALLEAQIKIFKMIQDRLKGAVEQRLSLRSHSTSVAVQATLDGRTARVAELVGSMDTQALEAKLASLEAQSAGSSPVKPPMKDVTSD